MPFFQNVCETFYSRSVANSSLTKETIKLLGTLNVRQGMQIVAGRRTRLVLGFPCTDDGTILELKPGTCPVCGNLDPWSPGSTGAFYHKIIAGTPEYVRRVPGRLIRHAATDLGCLTCGIIHQGLTAFSEVHYSTEDGWLDEEMKIIITGNQRHAGLMVGSRKTKRVEFFVLPGKISRFLTRC
jgi:hypothetical protein